MYAELINQFWRLPKSDDPFQDAYKMKHNIENLPEFTSNDRLQSMMLWLIQMQTSSKEQNSLEIYSSLWEKIKKIPITQFTVLPISHFILRYFTVLKKTESTLAHEIVQKHFPVSDKAISWKTIFSETSVPRPDNESKNELFKIKVKYSEILSKYYYEKKDWHSLANTYHQMFKIILENPQFYERTKVISWLAAFAFRLSRCGWLKQSQLHLNLAEFLIRLCNQDGEYIPPQVDYLVNRAWVILYRTYLERSTAKILSKAYETLENVEPWNLNQTEKIEDMNFDNIKLDKENLNINNGDDAFKIFLSIIFHLLQIPLTTFDKVTHLSIYLAFLAENQNDIDKKYQVQKIRSELLDFAIANYIKKNNNLHNRKLIPLIQDLAEVQLEMININLERMSTTITDSEDVQEVLCKMEATARIHMRLKNLGKALGEAQDRDDPEFAKHFM